VVTREPLCHGGDRKTYEVIKVVTREPLCHGGHRKTYEVIKVVTREAFMSWWPP
jgi:hypothetical protein